MKYGIDIDGTISFLPEFFALLTKALIDNGHEVHIITYRSKSNRFDTMKDLENWSISYTELHMAGYSDSPMHLWKASLAEKLNIDVMFDDSIEIIAAMPKKVKRLWIHDPDIIDLSNHFN